MNIYLPEMVALKLLKT